MTNKNNYKIIFSDVDGTLLNKERELSMNTVQQIKQAVNNHSLKFVMVSARMPQGMLHLYDQIALDFPIICYNGALILKSLTGGYSPKNIIHSNTINHTIVKDLFQKAKTHNLHFSVFSNNSWFANNADEWTLREENNTRVKATVCESLEALINNLEKNNDPIHKLMVMGDSSILDAYIDYSHSNYYTQVVNYRSKDTYIEISPISSNKAKGCMFLLNYIDIQASESIAFGDNHNDIEMLKIAGLGIAMDNAPEEVKRIAKQIAPSNLCDGVASKLREIFE